jgi:chloramphenicol 3-O-phosphotransferase
MKMIIRVNLRNISEIKEAFNARPNKKDSFNRWFHRLNHGGGWFEFHVDDKNMNPVER